MRWEAKQLRMLDDSQLTHMRDEAKQGHKV